MKNTFKILTMCGLAAITLSFKKANRQLNTCAHINNTKLILTGRPPKTWQEHWFEHVQLVSLVYYDDNVAVYYDNQMDKSVKWPFATMSKTWAYVKKNYGPFGDSTRLYVILHQGRYGGGHPASYFDSSHDYRNVIDCGLGDWMSDSGQNIGVPIHETGHIVCGSSNGVQGAPSDAIWGDSKFMEIFNYDVLMHIGRESEAAHVYRQMQEQDPNVDYPGIRYPSTRWFINWFYPIYIQYGKGALLSKYFKVIAANYPKAGEQFSRKRDMNLGEFVHFWSGAANADLKNQAKIAFGKYWNDNAENDLIRARVDFPDVKYPIKKSALNN